MRRLAALTLGSLLLASAATSAAPPIPPRVRAPNAVNKSSTAAVAGTTSTTQVMGGVALSFTPKGSGSYLITFSGTANNGTVVNGCQIQFSYGTGGAPAFAATLTGTQSGFTATMQAAVANSKQNLSGQALITGLTPGTTYWGDVAINSTGGGNCIVSPIAITAVEL